MNKKILLIDDSKTQLSTFKILFTRAGYDVETACDGIEGCQKIFETAPDIIVSDIIMPKLNGYQFCRLLKDNPLSKDIPIVLLTVLEQKIDKFWSKKSGADAFLLKSTDIQDTLATINDLIQKYPVPEETKQKLLKKSFSPGLIQVEINQILDNALMRSSILNEFRLLSMHLEDTGIMAKNLFELLTSVLNYDLSLLIINPPGGIEKEIFASHCSNIEDDMIKKTANKCIANIFGEGTTYKLRTIHENWTDIAQIDKDLFENSYIHQIKYEDNIIGAICFFGSTENIENQELLHVVLKEIDLLITIQALYAQNKFLSLTDSLTGLYNRRYLMETLEREYARAKRHDSRLCIAMIDIDFFKKINDTYGHQAGDFILKESTQLIKNMLRKSDILFRYGGEEVLAIMPETSKENAIIPIQRIKSAIEQKEFNYNGKNIKITISIGITDSWQSAETLELFIEHADKAMYTSKKNGRNQVTVYYE